MKIFEIEKGAVSASDVSGLMIINLEMCDVVLVPNGAERLIDCICPRDINMLQETSNKSMDILAKLIQ